VKSGSLDMDRMSASLEMADVATGRCPAVNVDKDCLSGT
jgi:hypothetical protein